MYGRNISVCFLALACDLSANAQTLPRAFAVASVKPSNPSLERGPSRIDFLPGGRFVAANVSVIDLIRAAYGLTGGSRVAKGRGCPGWVDSERFDINAVPDERSSDRSTAVSVMRTMVQQLLAARFNLVVSRQSKELPVYELTTGGSGVKLTPSTLTESDCQTSADCHRFKGNRMSGWQGLAVTLGDLALAIGAISDRPVVDSTNITGLYSLEIRPFASMRTGMLDFVVPPGYPPPPQEPFKPSLFSVPAS